MSRPNRFALPAIVLAIATALAFITAPNLRAQGKDFESLLGDGKEHFMNAERLRNGMGQNVDEMEKEFHAAVASLEAANAIDSNNQEVHYFLAYAIDRLSALVSPGDSLANAPDLALCERISSHLERVLAISPTYEGEIVILEPGSKLTAAWGSLAISYQANHKHDSALWALREGRRRGGFAPVVNEFCANILRSCDTNAILLVNGDMDTFPMWYVQAIDGFRRDVTVVNLSLLNTWWYPKSLRDDYAFGSNNLSLGATDEVVETTVAQQIEAPYTITLPITRQNAAQAGAIVRGGAAPAQLMLRITGNSDMPDYHYLRVQDYLLLDILAANEWHRPVFVSSTVDTSWMAPIGLEEHLQPKGLAERVVARRHQFNVIEAGDADRIYDLFTGGSGGFAWSALMDKATVRDREVTLWARAYVLTGLQLMDFHAGKKQAKRLDAVASRVLELIPSVAADDRPELLRAVAGAYRRIGDTKRGDQLLEQAGEGN